MGTLFLNYLYTHNSEYIIEYVHDPEYNYNFSEIEEYISKIKMVEEELEYIKIYYQKRGWKFTCNAQIVQTVENHDGIIDRDILSFIRFSIMNRGLTFFREFPIDDNINNNLKMIVKTFNEEISRNLCNLKGYNSASYIALSSNSSAYLVHEIFGHTFERDSPLLPNIISKLYIIGDRILDEEISVYDDPNSLISTLRYGAHDAEGEKYRREYVIKNGIWSGLITKRRKGIFSNKALYRMTNLILEAKSVSVNLSDLPNEYIYIDYTYQGSIDLITGDFQLWSTLGVLYRDSKPIAILHNPCIRGNIKDLFNNIKAMKNQSDFYVGTCIKLHQRLIVGMASPPLFISHKLDVLN